MEINEITFYTDLKWSSVTSRTRWRLYVYVVICVQTIRKVPSCRQWKYVDTSENPADLSTRCLSAQSHRIKLANRTKLLERSKQSNSSRRWRVRDSTKLERSGSTQGRRKPENANQQTPWSRSREVLTIFEPSFPATGNRKSRSSNGERTRVRKRLSWRYHAARTHNWCGNQRQRNFKRPWQ